MKLSRTAILCLFAAVSRVATADALVSSSAPLHPAPAAAAASRAARPFAVKPYANQQKQPRISSSTALSQAADVAVDLNGGAAQESGGTASVPNLVFNLVKSIVGAFFVS